MRRDVARQLGLDVLEVGEVLRETDELAGTVERRLGELHQAARAADDDVVAFGLRHHRAARTTGERSAALADRAGGDLAPLGERLLRRRVDRRGIGAVAVDERQIGDCGATPAAAADRAGCADGHAGRAPPRIRPAPRRGPTRRRARAGRPPACRLAAVRRRPLASSAARSAISVRGMSKAAPSARSRATAASSAAASFGSRLARRSGNRRPFTSASAGDRTGGEALVAVAMIPAIERGRGGAEHGILLSERRRHAIALPAQAQRPLRQHQQHGGEKDEYRDDCARDVE